MSRSDTTFGDDAISISNYPFRPGSVRLPLRIAVREILEVDVGHCALRIGDEVIYLPGWPRVQLQEFCEKHALRTLPRYHVWSDILDPYVDTSFTAKQVEERNQRLQAAGFGRARVCKLRLLVALPIVLYQGIAGEWTGLDAYDLMGSLRFLRLFGLYGLAYRAIMKIALEPYGGRISQNEPGR
jgi:hypothetical protein